MRGAQLNSTVHVRTALWPGHCTALLGTQNRSFLSSFRAGASKMIDHPSHLPRWERVGLDSGQDLGPQHSLVVTETVTTGPGLETGNTGPAEPPVTPLTHQTCYRWSPGPGQMVQCYQPVLIPVLTAATPGRHSCSLLLWATS